MTNDQLLKHQIESALHQFADGGLATNALRLFNTLGYRSPRQPDLPTDPDAFLNALPDRAKLDRKQALFNEWSSVHVLFQLTDDELETTPQARMLFEARPALDNRRIESYLFAALDLKGDTYTRTQLAAITRQVNRLSPCQF